ncbi:hypothetical protein Tsubulata_049221 [Turnera subulata]|uniref:Uncharacterized protein n=1 Tax=Turnera subulata TaxID=218843 RepID=A0A9Q0FNB5_9ROSI|nr:hypothetical protein Tsubulata_049221 [Turnera subulata]
MQITQSLNSFGILYHHPCFQLSLCPSKLRIYQHFMFVLIAFCRILPLNYCIEWLV